AERAMMNAKSQRLRARLAAMPMLNDEADRRAAFVEAAVFQAGELERAGEQQRPRAEHPRVRQHPRVAIETAMQRENERVRDDAEREPDQQIAADDERQQLHPVTPRGDQALEAAEQR